MPAQAIGANLAIPWVDPWARWAVPNASMTNTSHSLAYFCAVSSTFFFSPLLKRHVLQQHQFAGGDVETAIHPVLDYPHRLAELLGQYVGHGLERILFGVDAFFGPAKVGGDHHFGPRFQAVLYGRHGCRDAGVGRHLAVLHRHVEVGADEYALALEIDIGHADETGHGLPPDCSV